MILFFNNELKECLSYAFTLFFNQTTPAPYPLTALLLSACNLNQIKTQGSASDNDVQWQARQQALKKIYNMKPRRFWLISKIQTKPMPDSIGKTELMSVIAYCLPTLGTTELDLNVAWCD